MPSLCALPLALSLACAGQPPCPRLASARPAARPAAEAAVVLEPEPRGQYRTWRLVNRGPSPITRDPDQAALQGRYVERGVAGEWIRVARADMGFNARGIDASPLEAGQSRVVGEAPSVRFEPLPAGSYRFEIAFLDAGSPEVPRVVSAPFDVVGLSSAEVSALEDMLVAPRARACGLLPSAASALAWGGPLISRQAMMDVIAAEESDFDARLEMVSAGARFGEAPASLGAMLSSRSTAASEESLAAAIAIPGIPAYRDDGALVAAAISRLLLAVSADPKLPEAAVLALAAVPERWPPGAFDIVLGRLSREKTDRILAALASTLETSLHYPTYAEHALTAERARRTSTLLRRVAGETKDARYRAEIERAARLIDEDAAARERGQESLPLHDAEPLLADGAGEPAPPADCPQIEAALEPLGRFAGDPLSMKVEDAPAVVYSERPGTRRR